MMEKIERIVNIPAKAQLEIAEQIIYGMNEAISLGYSPGEVLIVTMQQLGAGLAEMGVVIDLDRPIREELAPLARAYGGVRMKATDHSVN